MGFTERFVSWMFLTIALAGVWTYGLSMYRPGDWQHNIIMAAFFSLVVSVIPVLIWRQAKKEGKDEVLTPRG